MSRGDDTQGGEHVVILGDTHLHPSSAPELTRDLVTVIDNLTYPGTTLALSGDIYDLAALGHTSVTERLSAIAAVHGEFHRALLAATRRGVRILLVAGNHDHDIVQDAARRWFAEHTGGEVVEWFTRIGDLVHIEHGNQYDTDNAYAHPLGGSGPNNGGDPLGVFIFRHLISRIGDLRLLHANHLTAIPFLMRGVWLYGRRAPGLFVTFLRCVVEIISTADTRFAEARAHGTAREAEMAKRHELPLEVVHALAQLSAEPRQSSRLGVLRRFYLDRLAAMTLITVAVGLAVVGKLPVPSALTSVSILALVLAAMPNRYRGHVSPRLLSAASAIAALSNPRYVVFGHSHEAVKVGSYLNAGSFGFRFRGLRSLVEIEGGQARHRFVNQAGEILAAESPTRLQKRRKQMPIVTLVTQPIAPIRARRSRRRGRKEKRT